MNMTISTKPKWAKSELINLYRARGFREESSGRLYIPDFVYEMQRDNGLFKHQTPIDLEK